MTLKELQATYDLELSNLINKIKKLKARKVLLQLPDGLKQYSGEIVDYVNDNIENTDIYIWLGSCFGACDVPHIDDDFDLIVQFGHAEW